MVVAAHPRTLGLVGGSLAADTGKPRVHRLGGQRALPSHDNHGETAPTTHFRFPHSLQTSGTGSGKPTCLQPARDEVALFSHILWFGPGGAHSLVPAARQERRRAQWRSMMARQRHRRLVIDRREHDGMLVRHKARTEHLRCPSFASLGAPLKSEKLLIHRGFGTRCPRPGSAPKDCCQTKWSWSSSSCRLRIDRRPANRPLRLARRGFCTSASLAISENWRSKRVVLKNTSTQTIFVARVQLLGTRETPFGAAGFHQLCEPVLLPRRDPCTRGLARLRRPLRAAMSTVGDDEGCTRGGFSRR
jgi:hypothetical protein